MSDHSSLIEDFATKSKQVEEGLQAALEIVAAGKVPSEDDSLSLITAMSELRKSYSEVKTAAKLLKSEVHDGLSVYEYESVFREYAAKQLEDQISAIASVLEQFLLVSSDSEKYSEALNAKYLDENGALQTIIMGCYGIGVSRIIAGCAETSHDDSGIIWPVALAPYEVCVCPVKATDEAAMAAAEKIVADLEAAGVDAILDDRDERPGVKFKDADLVGFPVRVTIGKSLADGKVEVKWRWDADSSLVAVDEVAKTLTAQLEDERKTNARFYAAKKNGK